MMAQWSNLAGESVLWWKLTLFDTNFKSNSSSIGNVECLLGIELTSRLYKRVCWALNSHPPSMNYRRLITALGFRLQACSHSSGYLHNSLFPQSGWSCVSSSFSLFAFTAGRCLLCVHCQSWALSLMRSLPSLALSLVRSLPLWTLSLMRSLPSLALSLVRSVPWNLMCEGEGHLANVVEWPGFL